MERNNNKFERIEKIIPFLHSLLEKEERLWKETNYHIINSDDDLIDGKNRDESVQLIIYINQAFNLSPESLSLGICLFDKFLAACKVQEKYARVTAITCWFIAIKVNEDKHPSSYEIVQQTSGVITKSELLRMERIVLRKLDYDIRTTCGLEVLYKLHSLFLTAPSSQTYLSQDSKALSVQFLKCLSWYKIATRVKPSHLAMAIFVLHLEMINCNWEELSEKMCHVLSINFDDLLKIKNFICNFLHNCYDQIKTSKELNSNHDKANGSFDSDHQFFTVK